MADLQLQSNLRGAILVRLLRTGVLPQVLEASEFYPEFSASITPGDFEFLFYSMMKWLEDEGYIRFFEVREVDSTHRTYRSCVPAAKAEALTAKQFEGSTVREKLGTSDTGGMYGRIGEFVGGLVGGFVGSQG